MGNAGGYGQQDPSDFMSEYNALIFIIRRQLARVSTAKLVLVQAVDTDAKTVDCLPMANQLDGVGNATPQGQLFAIPYLYAQAGSAAMIMDPVVGDKGLMVCCDRDISAVLATKDIANPGSYRKLDAADGIYLFGLPGLNEAPTRWIKWTDSGIDITDQNNNKLTSAATGWKFTGNVIFENNLQLAGSIQSESGAEYAGDISTTGRLIAADVFTPTTVGGPPTISLRAHIHSANNTPPTPGH